jgi:hypothetical protein
MKASLKSIAIATALVALLAASASPIAAAQPDGAYSMLTASTYGRGTFVLNYTGTTTVNAGLLRLRASEEYFVIGRSIPCDGQPRAANRMFRVTGMTSAGGVLNFSRSVAIAGRVNSIWLGRTDGFGPTVCSLTINFTKLDVAAGDIDGDGALGLVKTGPGTLSAIAIVAKRPGGEARVSLTLDGLAGGDSYMVQGVGAACGHGVNPSQRYFSFVLKDVYVTSFKSRTVDLTQDELDALRSVRIRNTTDGTKWGCVPLSIIAILVG